MKKPGFSSSELQHTRTAAKGIAGKKLMRMQIIVFEWEARQTQVLNRSVGSGLHCNFRGGQFEQNGGNSRYMD